MTSSDAPERLNVALVGCGAVAASHAAAIGRSSRFRICALVDVDRARAESLLPLAPGASVAHSLEAVSNADAAVIAVPPSLHFDICVEALARRLHLLVEKPLVRSPAECISLIARARDAGTVVQPAHMRRFLPQTGWVRQVIRSGLLGEIHDVSVEEGYVFEWPVTSPAFFSPANGGVLFDTGPHVVDLLVHWFGALELTAYSDDARGGVEANASVELDFDGGKAHVELSRTRELRNQFIIVGSEGELRTSSFGDKNSLKVRGAPQQVQMQQVEVQELFDRQLEAWGNAIHGLSSESAATIEDALASLSLLSQCSDIRTASRPEWD